MLDSYRTEAAAREAIGIPPLPLTAHQTADLIELLKNPPAGEEQFLLDLFVHRVPAGVDEAASVKASYLAAVALGTEVCPLIDGKRATELLGTMLGGYNISALIELLDHPELAPVAAEGLQQTQLMSDAFHDVKHKADQANEHAKSGVQSWADSEPFTSRSAVPESLPVTCLNAPGAAN